MAASFTCHPDRPLFHGQNPHHHLDQAALASTLHPNLPPLDVTSRAISPCVSELSDTKTFYSAFEVTEITVNGCVSPAVSDEILDEPSVEMDAASLVTVKAPTATTASLSSNGLRTPKRKRTVSPSTPTSHSPRNPRSTSRSTGRSGPTSRRSSLHSHRRATSSLTPSISSRNPPETKRETLLALHRESCRLFQDNESTKWRNADIRTPSSPASTAMHSYFPPMSDYRSASEVSSPPGSPMRPLSDQLEHSSEDESHSPPQPTSQTISGAGDGSSKQTPATVIDWTSPSTRRREYEKIDRASRGVRGLWRRVAPRWCRPGDKRTPFFEEGENGKGNYEGSVRRFRMDLPDETETKPIKSQSRRGTDLRNKFTTPRRQNSEKTERRWPRLSRNDRIHTT
ncbi:hypothetical protein ASPWEDRAFT_176098 [Aspergillus wentii DTO 134E9]|uniref:Uncharacterized protein n=1 Tax=Aspergillus wentii DTO 134E9 TaxID=1073089 RepID=A0A1L9R7Z5_ASPWE|nr:uncharacterized protein ASPWEDRAFT_176098 [Aspergillus wentii DTO 134E9]KAI9927616.1 hypothetical protein MW887_003237 [Aspergillus wentii]OJJ30993.1 hypothetical protein ASPWEDRAFT_176098 [Aspergillus wentii DTO 134E9]